MKNQELDVAANSTAGRWHFHSMVHTYEVPTELIDRITDFYELQHSLTLIIVNSVMCSKSFHVHFWVLYPFHPTQYVVNCLSLKAALGIISGFGNSMSVTFECKWDISLTEVSSVERNNVVRLYFLGVSMDVRQSLIWESLEDLTISRDCVNPVVALESLLGGLQRLTSGDGFEYVLRNITTPSSLHTLRCGDHFNQNLKDVVFPGGLQHLCCGRAFNQSLENSACLLTLRPLFQPEFAQRAPAKWFAITDFWFLV